MSLTLNSWQPPSLSAPGGAASWAPLPAGGFGAIPLYSSPPTQHGRPTLRRRVPSHSLWRRLRRLLGPFHVPAVKLLEVFVETAGFGLLLTVFLGIFYLLASR